MRLPDYTDLPEPDTDNPAGLVRFNHKLTEEWTCRYRAIETEIEDHNPFRDPQIEADLRTELAVTAHVLVQAVEYLTASLHDVKITTPRPKKGTTDART